MGKDTAKTRQLSRRVLVEIDRDMTAKTAKVVWEHEIPVIEAIYGEGKCKRLDSSALDEGYTPKVSTALLPWTKKQEALAKPSDALGIGFVFVGDPRAEYDRLADAYGRINDAEGAVAVEKVYGRFQDGRFASMVGGADFDDLPETQLRSLIEAHGLAPNGGHKDMSDAEKAEAAAERAKYLQAGRNDLLQACRDGGVQLG